MKVRALLAVSVVGLAVTAAGTAAGGATNECRGIPVCIHVPGPWVAVPARGEATYLLACPRRRGVVAGLDARASSNVVHVSFEGRVGSPVSPGVTTTRYAFFRALSSRGTGMFQPFLGCVPTSGGSPRSTTSARSTTPGAPVERYARNVRLLPGARVSARQVCGRNEQLVGGWDAVAFRTKAAPPAALARLVHATRRMRGGRIVVSVTTSDALPSGVHAEVQVGAVCAR